MRMVVMLGDCDGYVMMVAEVLGLMLVIQVMRMGVSLL